MHRGRTRNTSNKDAFATALPWLPCVVLLVSLTATLFAWRSVALETYTRGETRFRTRAEDITQRIINRLQENETILLGGAALFNVHGDALSRSEWRIFASSLRFDTTNPGILGFGYSAWLPAAQAPALIRAIQAEGYPHFSISPSGDRPIYTAIIWLEPFNARNQKAFGYDMYTEPVRRMAMERARDTGQTSVSGKVILVQEGEGDIQNGLLMYVPSYRTTLPLETVEQRQEALRGFVYSPIRMNDLIVGALGKIPSGIDFTIHGGVQPTSENLLYNSALIRKQTSQAAHTSLFNSSRSLDIYGANWQLSFHSLPSFEQDFSQAPSFSLLLSGVIISVGLSLLTYQQGRSRQQALIIAKQMHEQLVTQQKFALHLQQSPLAVIEWDEQGVLTAWNPAAETIFGYATEAVLGRPLAMLFADDQWQQSSVILDIESSSKATWKNLTIDGRMLDCEWSTTRLQDQAGQILGTVALIQDVTERNHNEQALRHERNLLQAVMDGARNSHLVYLDREFNFVRVNRAYADTCGYTPEAMIGKNHFVLYPNAETEAIFRQVRDSVQPYEVQDRPFEFPDQPERGLTWWNWTLTPVIDESGLVNGLVFSLQETTTRKQLEMALQASEAQFRRLFEEHGASMLLIDPQSGRILRANKAAVEFYGYTREVLQGMTINQINCLPPENLAKILKQVSLGELKEFSVPHRLADGTICPVEVHTAPIAIDDKVVNFAIIHNISARVEAEEERKRLEAQNIQLQKAESLSRMAGAIAHHFNNKLQGVMMSLEMIRDVVAATPSGEHQQIERLSTSALKAAETAAEVSRLLLTYLGSAPCEFTVLDLAMLCRNYQPILRASIPETIEFHVAEMPTELMVEGNAGQLQQILTNLIANAWEACAGGQGKVTLSISLVEGGAIPSLQRFPIAFQAEAATYVCFQVGDTGVGIKEQDIERLFDPFFSSKFTGRGMGLPAVLGIVRAHKGAVVVESEEGVGSTFSIYLPLVRAFEMPVLPMMPVTDEQVPRGTILVVDDEIVTRKLVGLMLEHLGYTVLAAEDGLQALELFDQHHQTIVLVICDVVMPRMNGWETIAAIRQQFPHLPVILASGYSEAQVMDGRQEDADLSFLEKPFRFNQLRDRIARMLRTTTAH